MITIIHGADTAASRKYFNDEKQRYPEAVLIDGDKINLTDLAQILDGGGLFGVSKYLFIEQFITKKKKSTEFKEIASFINLHASEHTIVLWEGKEIEMSSSKSFQNPLMRSFKLPQTLFVLLDAIKPQNGKLLVSLFHQTIDTTEIEMVFFMIIRQFRLLLALSSQETVASGNEIDELKKMAPWQKNKLQQQASLFTISHLTQLYNKLYQIELGQKTGGLTSPISTAIDFLLLEV